MFPPVPLPDSRALSPPGRMSAKMLPEGEANLEAYNQWSTGVALPKRGVIITGMLAT